MKTYPLKHSKSQRLPVVGMKPTERQEQAERLLTPMVNEVLLNASMPTAEVQRQLLQGMVKFVDDTCRTSAIHDWAQYRDQLQRVVAAGNQLMELAGIASETGASMTDLQCGTRMILRRASRRFETHAAHVVETIKIAEKAQATAQRSAAAVKKGRRSHTPKHSLLDVVVHIVRNNGIDKRLPQKENANAGDYAPERYPLLVFADEVLSKACRAAIGVLGSSTLPADDKAAAIKYVQSLLSTRGSLVADLRSALLRSRVRFRRRIH